MGFVDGVILVRAYDELLVRLRSQLATMGVKVKASRLEIPTPAIIWVGNKTVLRNFMDYPRILRRKPEKLLMFMAKELATAASLDRERVIFVGRKDAQSISAVINGYIKQYVTCPVCGAPDTRLEKVARLFYLICEACGAKSVARE